MIKGAKYSYSNDSKGAYQVYEEIELTKDGQAKLNELLNDYALLATDVTKQKMQKRQVNLKVQKQNQQVKKIQNQQKTQMNKIQKVQKHKAQQKKHQSNSETTKKTAKIICK